MRVRISKIPTLPPQYKSAALGSYKHPDHIWPRDEYFAVMAKDWPAFVIGQQHTATSDKKEDEGTMADMVERFEDATQKVEQAYQRFDDSSKKLRGGLKNDAASVAAAAEKISQHMEKVRVAISEAERMLLSPSMESAIANAERLAAALGSISRVEAAKVSFSVGSAKDVEP